MTLPDERSRAVLTARDFLRELADPKKTPRVPSAIRRRALDALKHYPTPLDMERPVEAFAPIRQIADLTAHLARLCTCGHPLSKHQDWGLRLGREWAHEALECHGHRCSCPAFEAR